MRLSIVGVALASVAAACAAPGARRAPAGFFDATPRPGDSAAFADAGYDTGPDVRAWFELIDRGDTAAAVEWFGRAPDAAAPDARLGLGLALWMRGRYADAAQALALIARDNPKSVHALAAAALYGRAQLQSAEIDAALDPIVKAVADGPDATPEVRAHARRVRAEIAARRGDSDALSDLDRALGDVPRFAVSQAFGENDLLNLDTPYAPEGRDPLGRSMPGPFRTVEWRTIERDLRRPDLSNWAVYPGVIYAAAEFTLDAARDLVIAVQRDGAWRLMVDGVPALRNDAHREHLPVVRYTTVRFSAGRHRVLLKLAAPGGNAGFALRLLDTAGLPAEVAFADPIGSPGAVTGTAGPAGDDDPLDAVLSVARNRPTDVRAHLLAALVYAHRDDAYHAREHFDALLAHAPRFSAARLIAAVVRAEDPSQPEQLRSRRARREVEAVAAADPAAVPAHEMLARLETAEDKATEALDRMDRVAAAGLGSPRLWQQLKRDVYRRKNWRVEADASLSMLRSLDPESADLRDDELELRLDRLEFARAAAIEAEIAGRQPSARPRLEGLIRREAWQQALDLVTKRIGERPRDEDARAVAVSLLARLDRPREALNLLDAGADAASPPGFPGRRFSLWWAAGERDRAWAELSRAAADPEHTDVARFLDDLAGREPFAGDEPGGASLIAAFTADDWSRRTRADAVYVLDFHAARYFADGSGLSRTHVVARLMTKEAIDGMAEVSLPRGAHVYTLRGIKPDGTTIEAEQVAGKEALSIPRLEEGDFVEWDYVESKAPSRGAGTPLPDVTFVFDMTNTPVWRSRFVLETAPELDFAPEVFGEFESGAPGEPEVLDFERTLPDGTRMRRREWRLSRLKGITPEPSAPPQCELSRCVQVRAAMTDARVAAMLANRVAGLTRPTAELKALVEEADRDAGPRAAALDRVKTLRRLVGLRVEGPASNADFSAEASRILGAKKGNRLVLMKALLDIAGIEADFVAVRNAFIDAEANRRTSPAYWSGIFLVVPGAVTGGADAWIDGTFPYPMFGTFDPQYAGGPALQFTGLAAPRRFTAPDDQIRRVTPLETTLDITFDGAGRLKAEGRESITDVVAGVRRQQIETIAPEQVKRAIEGLLGAVWRGAKLAGPPSFENTESLDRPFVVSYRFESDRPARADDDGFVIDAPVLPLRLRDKYIKLPTRSAPYIQPLTNRSRDRVTLRLPPGAKVGEPKPRDAEFAGDFGSYRLRFRTGEEGEGALRRVVVTIERELDVPAQRFLPDRYTAFMAFCAAADGADTQRLHVALPR